MLSPLRYWLLARPALFAAVFITLCATLAALALPAAAAEEPRSSRLVDRAWLQQHRSDVLLLDASMTPQHRQGHIAGAVSVDFYRYGPDEPTPAAMAQRMQSWGISPGRKVVIYDQGGEWMAARLFHDLFVHGVPAQDLHLLDGGLARWKASGGVVTSEASPAPARGSWQGSILRSEERVRLPEFLQASGDPERHVLLDALEPSYHYGQQKFFDRAGHVPGAVLLPSEDFFNADKTFKSADEIRRLLRYHGVRAGQTVHSHCGGGGAAATPWFALRFIAGHASAKLYLGSQREWLRDDRGLPFWTYSAPQMLRDTTWLAGWNAPMMRAMGAARINLVDVRPAQAYAQGHVPFALNLPAAGLGAQLRQTAALAAALGPAGVQPEHEVVLVSDGGISKDAALAFVAFQQLGHDKVSLLVDSVDDWAYRGQETTRQPTRVGMPTAPGEMTVPPAVYPRRSVPSKLATASDRPSGEFPRVWVDVGAALATSTGPWATNGRALRVPYTELLGERNMPKPAPELWKIIDKAGVPRHAEVVLVADDASEAAVAYVVFKLMGWPDLKVALR